MSLHVTGFTSLYISVKTICFTNLIGAMNCRISAFEFFHWTQPKTELKIVRKKTPFININLI